MVNDPEQKPTIELQLDEDPPATSTPEPKAASNPGPAATAAEPPLHVAIDNSDVGLDPRLAELDTLRAENAKLKDQALRALAEAENARRRAERDREDASKYAVANFARALLVVADNLRRALEAVPADLQATDARVGALVDGIAATERELLGAFDKMGIRPVPALDLPFNAHQHEAIFEAPSTGKPAGTVVQVVEQGYTIHDRLLRPARVGVAKADPGAPAAVHHIDTQV
jgi:molecular chaperone GrpE